MQMCAGACACPCLSVLVCLYTLLCACMQVFLCGLFLSIYFFIWLFWVSVEHVRSLIFIVAFGIFSCGMRTLSCSRWDLVPCPGIKPRSPEFRVELRACVCMCLESRSQFFLGIYLGQELLGSALKKNYSLIFWSHYGACGILSPQPGIEPMPLAVQT